MVTFTLLIDDVLMLTTDDACGVDNEVKWQQKYGFYKKLEVFADGVCILRA